MTDLELILNRTKSIADEAAFEVNPLRDFEVCLGIYGCVSGNKSTRLVPGAETGEKEQPSKMQYFQGFPRS